MKQKLWYLIDFLYSLLQHYSRRARISDYICTACSVGSAAVLQVIFHVSRRAEPASGGIGGQAVSAWAVYIVYAICSAHSVIRLFTCDMGHYCGQEAELDA